jgi:PBP1b-binding outer membrane lipoprotein LpoB
VTKFRALIIFAAAALITAGCSNGGGGSESTPSSSAGASSNSTQMSDNQSPPNQLDIDVMIQGGKVTPTNEQLKASLREPIVIHVNSDVADELHVHSTPDHTFKVEAKPNQAFQFSVDMPGKVDVELHHLDKTIATIQVQ